MRRLTTPTRSGLAVGALLVHSGCALSLGASGLASLSATRPAAGAIDTRVGLEISQRHTPFVGYSLGLGARDGDLWTQHRLRLGDTVAWRVLDPWSAPVGFETTVDAGLSWNAFAPSAFSGVELGGSVAVPFGLRRVAPPWRSQDLVLSRTVLVPTVGYHHLFGTRAADQADELYAGLSVRVTLTSSLLP